MQEKKIVLIRPPGLGYPFDKNEPHIGLLELAAQISCLTPGWSAAINDLSGTYPSQWENIIDPNADIYGLSLLELHHQLGMVEPMIDFLRKMNGKAKIIVGGKSPTSNPKIYADNPNIASIFQYESDETLREYLQGGAIAPKNKIVRPIKPPDLQNIPSFIGKDTQIKGYGRKIMGRDAVPLLFQRGCAFFCKFCSAGSTPLDLKQMRFYSPERDKELIKAANKKGFTAAFIRDDNFFLPFQEKRYDPILEALNEHDFIFRFNSAARISLTNDQLKKLYASGGRIIDIALESGDPEVLAKMGKGHSPEQFVNKVKRAKEAGLIVYTYVMIGYPGETESSINLTEKVLREAEPNFTLIFDYTHYPGINSPPPETKNSAAMHVCDRADGTTLNLTQGGNNLRYREQLAQAIKEIEGDAPTQYESFIKIEWDTDRFWEELNKVK